MFLKIIIVVGLMLVGANYLYKAISLRVKSKAATQWPVTRGKLLSSEVKEDTLRNVTGKISAAYFCEVQYEYSVNGELLHGSRVTFGNPTYDYVTASRIRDKFAVDTEVNVYYNPTNSHESVLVPFAREAMRSLIPGIFFIASGLLIVAVMIIFG